MSLLTALFFFFFNDTATTEIYTLSLHDALPISGQFGTTRPRQQRTGDAERNNRSEEHTSELQSRVDISYAVFCLKKNKQRQITRPETTARGRASAPQ